MNKVLQSRQQLNRRISSDVNLHLPQEEHLGQAPVLVSQSVSVPAPVLLLVPLVPLVPAERMRQWP